jgi:hypothetical protein
VRRSPATRPPRAGLFAWDANGRLRKPRRRRPLPDRSFGSGSSRSRRCDPARRRGRDPGLYVWRATRGRRLRARSGRNLVEWSPRASRGRSLLSLDPPDRKRNQSRDARGGRAPDPGLELRPRRRGKPDGGPLTAAPRSSSGRLARRGGICPSAPRAGRAGADSEQSLLPNERFAGTRKPPSSRTVCGSSTGRRLGATTEIPTWAGSDSAGDFPVGRRFVGHFEADGVVSQEVSFAVGPDAIFVDAVSSLEGRYISVTHTLEEELVEGTLFLVVGTGKYLPVLSTGSSLRSAFAPVFPAAHRDPVHGGGGRKRTSYRSTTTLSYPQPAVARVVIRLQWSSRRRSRSQSTLDSEIPRPPRRGVSQRRSPPGHNRLESLEASRPRRSPASCRMAGSSTSRSTSAVLKPRTGSRFLTVNSPCPSGSTSAARSGHPPASRRSVCVVREEDVEWCARGLGKGPELRVLGRASRKTGPGRRSDEGRTSRLARALLSEQPSSRDSSAEGQKRLRLVVATSRL